MAAARSPQAERFAVDIEEFPPNHPSRLGLDSSDHPSLNFVFDPCFNQRFHTGYTEPAGSTPGFLMRGTPVSGECLFSSLE